MEKDAINKMIGYLLLLVGLVMIAYSVFDIYQVFNGKAMPYKLFNFSAIAIDLGKFVPGAPSGQNLMQEMISSDLLNKPMNMVFHLIFMGFIATAGQKIAGIGVTLARAIKVNIKEEKSVLLPPR